MMRAEIGVIGGTGFYSFFEGWQEITLETPFGSPSDAIALGEIDGRKVAFMPRHGREHSIPPHMINYRANLWAMHDLGVNRILSSGAAGSLVRDIHPGDFVVSDQLIDRTSGRKDTYFDGPLTTHISIAEPFCPVLREVAIKSGASLQFPVHDQGTMVIIQGPRFSTKAESRWYASQGWHIIGMTQLPEAALARELQMCIANVSLITDYDSGIEGTAAVTADEAVTVFKKNAQSLQTLIEAIIESVPEERDCDCESALDVARPNH
ncbi:MAG: S-methyl-5'-thioadenosine phosphorylase [Actinomycetota bacterium]